MKKLALVFSIILLASTSVSAQDINFGVKGGLNFANISGTNINADNKTGFHIGLALEVSLLKTFAIQPELLYSTQGAKSDGAKDLKLDYISLPILAKYYIVPGILSLEAGPQFSFLMNDDISVLDVISNEDTDASSFDLGGAIGLGVKIPGGLFGQVRYVRGITTVAENPDVNNNLFQVSLGYNF